MKHLQHFGHQASRVGQTIAWGAEGDDCDLEFAEVLLMRKVRIHRHQDIELIPLGAFQQRAVLDARPAEQGNRFDLMPRQLAAQAPVEVLVEQKFQIRQAAGG